MQISNAIKIIELSMQIERMDSFPIVLGVRFSRKTLRDLYSQERELVGSQSCNAVIAKFSAGTSRSMKLERPLKVVPPQTLSDS